MNRREMLCGIAGLGLLPGGIPMQEKERVPGVVLSHSPAKTQIYVGSPGLAMLPDGTYLASHEWFGKGFTSELALTLVFVSEDRGKTWKKRAEVEGAGWASLFLHRGALYLMGVNHENGLTVIRRSTNDGKTWTTARDKRTGLLLDDGKYHCAPVPVVMHRGRLWRAMENVGMGGWGKHFRAFMMSAPEDADLLDAANWTCSNRLARDETWLDNKFGGWLEGNAVLTPEGEIVNILRVDYREGVEKAAIIEISEDGKTATFDPKTGFIDFPGGCKKFTIRFDPVSKRYWSLTNYVPQKYRGGNPERTRNTLALTTSPDLRNWEVRAILLEHPDSEKHGFQYADWLFDGEDIIALVRTAYDDGEGGAHNQHDANYLTFHRIADFRRLKTSV